MSFYARRLDVETKQFTNKVDASAQSSIAKNAHDMLYSVNGGVTNWGIVNITTPDLQQDPVFFAAPDQAAFVTNIVYVAPPANTLLIRKVGDSSGAVFAISGLQSLADLGLTKNLNELEFALDQAPLPLEMVALLWRF